MSIYPLTWEMSLIYNVNLTSSSLFCLALLIGFALLTPAAEKRRVDVKPVALRMVWQVVRSVKIPVIGIGGISTAVAALEFLITGASAVQIGTANFIHPAATMEIIGGIEDYMIRHRIGCMKDLIGSLQTDFPCQNLA